MNYHMLLRFNGRFWITGCCGHACATGNGGRWYFRLAVDHASFQTTAPVVFQFLTQLFVAGRNTVTPVGGGSGIWKKVTTVYGIRNRRPRGVPRPLLGGRGSKVPEPELPVVPEEKPGNKLHFFTGRLTLLPCTQPNVAPSQSTEPSN